MSDMDSVDKYLAQKDCGWSRAELAELIAERDAARELARVCGEEAAALRDLAEGREKLLIAYRLGARTPEGVLKMIERAQRKLASLATPAPEPDAQSEGGGTERCEN